MAPPLSTDEENALFTLYYEENNYYGRDKLWKLANDRGIKISRRQVMDWLEDQEINQLYRDKKPIRKIQPTLLNRPFQQLGIDIVNMENLEMRGYKYLLNAVDLFSKMGYSRALKTKSSKEVSKALKEILEEAGEPITTIRTDNGAEFKNSEFKRVIDNQGIKHIFSMEYTPQSNGAVERFNGVIKKIIEKAKYRDQTFNWVANLPKIINNYNNSYHSSIKMTPIEASQGDDNQQVRENIKKRMTGNLDKDTINLKVGDIVRIKKTDEDGANWSKETYKIIQVLKPKNGIALTSYKLQEIDKKYKLKQKIPEKFYNSDLLKIPSLNIENSANHPERFEVSRIVKPQMHDGEAGYIVRWKGYTASDNTWEPRKSLLETIPKMVNKFDRENKVKWTINRFRWEPAEKN